MKDVDRRRDVDDDRENANGDDRKGNWTPCNGFGQATYAPILVDVGSPIPAHDELDTAE